MPAGRIRSASTGSSRLLLRQYALPPELEREPRSEDGSTGPVARSGIVSTYASLQAANGIDLYKALGISSQASPLEIKVAFRKLAKALHPDRMPETSSPSNICRCPRGLHDPANAEWRDL
jgi:hypothetical protein